ncbi:putative serine/threonine-protein kinase [Termitomyces sp. T112]|nr:putative serine/threonine-protein kinase [Termitomyces sp. T112]
MPRADKTTTSTASASKRAPVKSLRGVPRAKSGCYTCRIRRKKCDEQPNEQGRCATCVRLRLECLGFGAKRPEWLRASGTLAEIRERIKFFLASQGMVKGYSGTAHQGFSFQDYGQQYHATAPTTSTITPSTSNNGGFVHQMDIHVPYNRPGESTSTSTSSPPQRFRPISFGRGTQHLLNQDDMVPERPRPSTSYFRSTAEDPYDRRCEDSMSDLSSEVSEGDKIERLISRLEDLFANKSEYKTLLSCRGPTAQKLLDMFQRLLDVMYDPPPRFERHLIVATQKLATKSGLYPTCHELSDTDITIYNIPDYSGGFCDIFKGAFQGSVVCLKMLRLDRSTDLEYFLKIIAKETILWGQLRHPNVLPFYGVFRIKNRISFIAPWMDYGDITAFLKRHNDSNRAVLSFDVAQGLQFLHKNGIVHGNLKGTNILVNQMGRACLVDFGLSMIIDTMKINAYSSESSTGGAVRWQAPELFDPERDDVRSTEASDIYAWACVAYEIFTGQIPFAHLNRNTVIITKITSGERPARPPDSSPSWGLWGLTEDIWMLIRTCWHGDPVRRPTVGMIIEQLEMALPAGMEMDMRIGSVLSPAVFREMTRRGVDDDELCVEKLERLITM